MLTRTIYVVGEINEEAFLKFCRRLSRFEDDTDYSEVTIILSSIGGNAMDALAFRARMRSSPCNLKVMGVGVIGSAATLILLSGDIRSMDRDALFMTHEDKAKINGRISNLEHEVANLRMIETHWNRICAEASKLTLEEWNVLNLKDTYFTAAECLKHGIIDKIDNE